MRFKKSLWDDSDPTYAPFLKKIRGTFKWIPSAKYRDAGYPIKTLHLGGHDGDGCDLERAFQCRELTRELVNWWEGQQQGRKEGTWGWLVGRYLHDEYSDFQAVKPMTREGYRKVIARIEEAIGDVLICDTDYQRMMEWQITMRRKGRSDHFIKKWFTHWGMVNSHGVKLGMSDCRRIKEIRSEMRISGGGSRRVYAERADVEAIVAEADKRGLHWLSLAVLLRFEFSLRGVDVYGQWEPAEGREGGISYQPSGSAARRVWTTGLTWDMIDSDMTRIEKLISKTARSMPDPHTFPLHFVPHIRERLMAIPEAQRVGPVIVLDDGMPPRNGIEAKWFRKIVKHLKLNDELQIRDTRAGGITEASGYDNPFAVQQSAQHTQLSTTQRYIRDRDRGVAEVLEFRQSRKNG